MPYPHRCALRALALSLLTPSLVALCPRSAHLALPTSLCPHPCPPHASHCALRALTLSLPAPSLCLLFPPPLALLCRCALPAASTLALPTLLYLRSCPRLCALALPAPAVHLHPHPYLVPSLSCALLCSHCPVALPTPSFCLHPCSRLAPYILATNVYYNSI